MGLIGLKTRFWLRTLWLKHIRRASYAPPEPIFFIHIPKTAGTSFRNMLFRLIDQELTFPSLLDLGDNQGNYPQLDALATNFKHLDRDIKFLSGHYPFACGELLPTHPKYYVFLREPVGRTISNLIHFKKNQADCQNLSLLEIFEKHKLHLQNLQTRFLCDTTLSTESTFYHPHLLSEKALIQAKANLEKCTFVGITEDFPASIKIAEKILNAKLGYQLRRNVSKTPAKKISPDLSAQLRPYLQLDIELYQYALEIFSQQKNAKN